MNVHDEREFLKQGVCPSSRKRIMPDGILRPACAICECGEESAAARTDARTDTTGEPQ